jgi:hypothetical protein
MRMTRGYLIFAVLALLLSSCRNSPAQTVAIPSTGQEVAAPEPEPEIEIDEDAQAHYEAAADYMAHKEPGFALVEISQALAIQPEFPGGDALRRSVIGEATAVVVAQERAIAVAAQMEATKAAQVQIEARATATAQAQALAQAQLQTLIGSYARMPPPKGAWWTNGPNGLTVAVGGFEYRSDLGRFRQAPPGYRYITMVMIIDNRGTQVVNVNPLNATLVDQEKVTHTYDSGGYSWFNEPMQAVSVRPGNSSTGALAFQVRNTTGPARVIYSSSAFRGVDIVVNLERLPDERG